VKSGYRSGCRGRLQCQVQLYTWPAVHGSASVINLNGAEITHVLINEVMFEEAMPPTIKAGCSVMCYITKLAGRPPPADQRQPSRHRDLQYGGINFRLTSVSRASRGLRSRLQLHYLHDDEQAVNDRARKPVPDIMITEPNMFAMRPLCAQIIPADEVEQQVFCSSRQLPAGESLETVVNWPSRWVEEQARSCCRASCSSSTPVGRRLKAAAAAQACYTLT
jgi:hypothetical protein